MTPIGIEATMEVRRTKGDRIIPSRFALRYKPVDVPDGIEYKAKARWLLVGFHDPDVLILEVSSPTPHLQTINCFCSVSAGLRREVHQGDLEEAFLQAGRIHRELYAEQPKEGIPGMQPGELLRVETEVYGSGAG